MRLVTWSFGLIVAVVTVSFAVSNRDPVTISVWPFPFALNLGLYIIVLISVLAGFVAGALVTWLAAGKHRRRVRKQRAEIRNMENELDTLRNRTKEPANKAA